MAYQKVLVASDFSERSDHALRMGAKWSQAMGASLSVCHVLPELWVPAATSDGVAADLTGGNAPMKLQDTALQALADQFTRVTGHPADGVDLRMEEATPHAGILQAQQHTGAELVVVGAHGSSATTLEDMLLGSVTERVVRYSPTAVLVARAASEDGPVVVATDLSAAGQNVVAVGAQLHKALKRPLVVLHCLDLVPLIPPSLLVVAGDPVLPTPEVIGSMRNAARQVLDSSLGALEVTDATVEVLEGRAAQTLAHRADALKAGCFVVGTHGRSGLSRLLLGSVAEQLVRLTHVPVLVVRNAKTS